MRSPTFLVGWIAQNVGFVVSSRSSSRSTPRFPWHSCRPPNGASPRRLRGSGTANPFLPERVELERRALGPRYIEVGPIIRSRPGEGLEQLFGNVPAMRERAQSLATEIGRRLEAGRSATRAELLVYEDLSLYLLYGRYMSALDGLVSKSLQRDGVGRSGSLLEGVPGRLPATLPGARPRPPLTSRPEDHLRGLLPDRAGVPRTSSARSSAARCRRRRLRAAVWQSIFTHDMRRYTRSLHGRMADIPTLIAGPSGSGKELVARAIGLSCFIPFDPGTRSFRPTRPRCTSPLNLSALSPTLIESELFGHVKGAFTGAHEDRAGWLERCGPHGAVFLDEIGELDAAIQVKLLRVLETRQFQRVGSTDTLPFKGKIIAATNRDLAAEMHAGRFRHDLYYRLCADQIVTPSLAEQLADRPEDLPELVRFIAREVLVKRTDDPNDLALDPAADDGSRRRWSD